MRTINLNGYIDEEVWYGDEITPSMLHDALYGENSEFSDDVRIILNSYGGSCKRVAAYCRVSTDSEAQETSIETQRAYFEHEIGNHPGWKLVQIYADQGVTAARAASPGEPGVRGGSLPETEGGGNA